MVLRGESLRNVHPPLSEEEQVAQIVKPYLPGDNG